MKPPAEDGLDDMPDSPPHVPLNFMNGYRNWHIVIEPNGQEIIELVTSDEEDEGEIVIEDHAVNGPDPMEAFWDIEMGQVVDLHVDPLAGRADSSSSGEETDDEEEGPKDIGVQCNLGAAKGNAMSDSDEGRDSPASDMEESMDSDTSSDASDHEDSPPTMPLPPAVYVCGGRGRLCVRGRGASSSSYVGGSRGRHCFCGGPSLSTRGRM